MNCQDLNEIEGLQFIPVNGMKQPIVKEWQTSTKNMIYLMWFMLDWFVVSRQVM